jgi:alanyl-tRNA synthetase
MTTNEIRSKFLEFFKSKGHTVIPSAPVVPEHDPTVLFTTAGMHPLVPYLLGEDHPGGRRLANSQKCVRTTDIDEVGDNRHLTMFEMLGNWSLGDYYKQESIGWSFEFLTGDKWLGIDPHKLYVTVYEGDSQVPKDEESIEIWRTQFKSAGIDAKEGERIQMRGRDDNWWEQGGVETGPAGPDTEIFYYLGSDSDPEFKDTDEFIEIWNNVFMAYQRQKDGSYVELANKNVDTGMGLERIAAVMQGVSSVFETDLFKKIEAAVTAYADDVQDRVYREVDSDLGRAVRIITDHMRSGVFMAADGVRPSNNEQGYVMRRLLRRAIRQGLILGIRKDLAEQVAPVVIELYGGAYPELEHERNTILDILSAEESRFRSTLDRGVREFIKLAKPALTGEAVFKLFDTYGFPPELSIEDAKREAIPVDSNWDEAFQRLMNEQRERSRTASAGEYKGGLADHSAMSIKYHTATHLMYKALKLVLGDHVVQRGSNITQERLRFDFSHPEKLTSDQIKRVEEIVNQSIERDWPMGWREMETKAAMAQGVLGAFGDKYGETVKVYTAGDPDAEWFSQEICGGPHVTHTGELGEDGKQFKITKEESSSAGVRRIKAVLQ